MGDQLGRILLTCLHAY